MIIYQRLAINSTSSRDSGSEGYVAYESNINIIHDVSNIFPVALYFMAALVTFVTMGRFVEEERGKAGIFNALGYSNSMNYP